MKNHKNAGFYPRAASICALILLLASFAQAVHICTPLRTLGTQSLAISDSYCAICAASQPPRQITIHPPLVSLSVSTRIVPAADAKHHSYLVLFGLNVRPPPAQV